jgi:hypothetical protein
MSDRLLAQGMFLELLFSHNKPLLGGAVSGTADASLFRLRLARLKLMIINADRRDMHHEMGRLLAPDSDQRRRIIYRYFAAFEAAQGTLVFGRASARKLSVRN